MRKTGLTTAVVFTGCVAAIIAFAQTPPGAPQTQGPAAAPVPAAQAPANPAPANPPAPQGTVVGGLNFKNGAQLLDVIDLLAQELKLNYVLDASVPRTGNMVVLNTYGVVRDLDLRQVLETILRMNNLVMVQVGNMYRIGLAANVSSLPIQPVSQSDSTKFADDDHEVLNLIFLRYMTSAEMAKVLDPFKGEGAKITSYDPANLLIILDSSRNMRRTLDLINLFDSDALAGQRVRAYELKNAQPSAIKKELDEVFKAYSLSTSKSGGAVQFVPVDRINTLLAVAPNAGVFTEVEAWLTKLDIPAKVTVGAVDNHVYPLKYQRADVLGAAVGQLYGIPVNNALGMLCASAAANTAYPASGGVGGNGYGSPYGAGAYGAGGYGAGGYGAGGYGAGGYGAGGYGSSPYGGYNATGYGNSYNPQYAGGQTGLANPLAPAGATGTAATGAAGPAGTTGDQTGTYLNQLAIGFDVPGRPRIVPNPCDSTLLVRSTPEQWQEIKNFIEQLDVSPRQVLIEAKIYEVDLTGNLTAGVEAFLQKQSGASHLLTGSSNGGMLSLSAGTVVGQARELLATLQASEVSTKAKVISSPSVIATDSIPASIIVGDSVPTLSSQSVNPGVTSGGNSLFTNTITNVSTGTGLNILAHVNPSGVVTMVINQTVTAPTSTSTSAIDSPSFSQRNVSTQVTVDDGDMVAIGGIIDESTTNTSNGIPFLDRLPGLGFLFGTKSTSKQRTELIVFLTPHVIADTHKISDATEQLKEQMKGLRKTIQKNP
jgi:general secretion pathway protein D